MKFNLGDEVICKRDVHDRDMVAHYHKGGSYEIQYVGDLWVRITSLYKGGWNFSMSKLSSASILMFEDYFYTEKELRKIKLEKINNV